MTSDDMTLDQMFAMLDEVADTGQWACGDYRRQAMKALGRLPECALPDDPIIDFIGLLMAEIDRLQEAMDGEVLSGCNRGWRRCGICSAIECVDNENTAAKAAGGGGSLMFLAAELEQMNAIVGQLPQCWRLINSKLEQSQPIVPGVDVWIVSPVECRYVFGVNKKTIDLGGAYYMPHDLADSREAAKAVRKERAQ